MMGYVALLLSALAAWCGGAGVRSALRKQETVAWVALAVSAAVLLVLAYLADSTTMWDCVSGAFLLVCFVSGVLAGNFHRRHPRGKAMITLLGISGVSMFGALLTSSVFRLDWQLRSLAGTGHFVSVIFISLVESLVVYVAGAFVLGWLFINKDGDGRHLRQDRAGTRLPRPQLTHPWVGVAREHMLLALRPPTPPLSDATNPLLCIIAAFKTAANLFVVAM